MKFTGAITALGSHPNLNPSAPPGDPSMKQSQPSSLRAPLSHVRISQASRWTLLSKSSPVSLTSLSLIPSDCLISTRGKCPISVIFYFVMKVSRGCEKVETHHKSLPWENRVERTLVCSVSSCFIHSLDKLAGKRSP